MLSSTIFSYVLFSSNFCHNKTTWNMALYFFISIEVGDFVLSLHIRIKPFSFDRVYILSCYVWFDLLVKLVWASRWIYASLTNFVWCNYVDISVEIQLIASVVYILKVDLKRPVIVPIRNVSRRTRSDIVCKALSRAKYVRYSFANFYSFRLF